MRVLELLWQDQHRIATDLRAAVTPEAAAAHNRAERAAGWDEGGRRWLRDQRGSPPTSDADESPHSNPYRADALDGGDE